MDNISIQVCGFEWNTDAAALRVHGRVLINDRPWITFERFIVTSNLPTMKGFKDDLTRFIMGNGKYLQEDSDDHKIDG